jgi:hypothetical protein
MNFVHLQLMLHSFDFDDLAISPFHFRLDGDEIPPKYTFHSYADRHVAFACYRSWILLAIIADRIVSFELASRIYLHFFITINVN